MKPRPVWLFLLAAGLLLAGCFPVVRAAPLATPTPTATHTATPVPTRTDTPTPSLTASQTASPSATASPLPTLTATSTPPDPPESLTAPILLYHHIKESKEQNRYFVDPKQFGKQMQALHDWGYNTITVSTLAAALTGELVLPQRPVAITFDDGLLSVYENAYPVMQALGFVGTVYVVTDQLDLYGYMGAAQLKELAAAGWEIGSHSRTHTAPDQSVYGLRMEMEWTRTTLEQTLEVPVTSYSYPFGIAGEYVRGKAEEYGYTCAVGLGILNEHRPADRYYLTRREVHYEFDLRQFGELLPWTEPPQ